MPKLSNTASQSNGFCSTSPRIPPRGFDAPNYTQTPNTFFDEILTQITSLSELKVTLAIIRQTFGWHRREAELSISRLKVLTGLSKQAVINGLELGIQRGFMLRRPKGQTFVYHLNLANDLDQPTNSTSQRFRPEVVNDLDQRPVNDLDPIKKDRKNQLKKPSLASVGDVESSARDNNQQQQQQQQPITEVFLDHLQGLRDYQRRGIIVRDVLEKLMSVTGLSREKVTRSHLRGWCNRERTDHQPQGGTNSDESNGRPQAGSGHDHAETSGRQLTREERRIAALRRQDPSELFPATATRTG